jgi:hypothetical protein
MLGPWFLAAYSTGHGGWLCAEDGDREDDD